MSFEPKQMEMICLEDLVPENHIYRKFQTLWNLKPIRIELEKLEADSDTKSQSLHEVVMLRSRRCALIKYTPTPFSSYIPTHVLIATWYKSLLLQFNCAALRGITLLQKLILWKNYGL